MHIIQRKKALRTRAAAVLLALTMVVPAILSGCGADEISLATALINEPDKLSYEYEGDFQVSVKFDFTEPEKDSGYYSIFEEAMIIKIFEALTEGAGFNIKSKYIADEDKTKIRSENFFTPLAFGGKLDNFTFGLWTDLNMAEDGYALECVKLPKLYNGALWKFIKDKEYITVSADDLSFMYDELGIYAGDMLASKKFADYGAATELFKRSVGEIMLKIAVMTDAGSAYVRSVDRAAGQGATYHISITDKGLKELIAGIAKISKSDMKNSLKSVMTALVEYMAVVDPDGEFFNGDDSSIGLDFQSALDNYDFIFELMYPQFRSGLDEFLTASKKIKLLGSGGLNLDIHISDEGYVTDVNCDADVVIDHRGIEIAQGNRFYGNISKTHILVSFASRFTNVNGDVEIDMPELTRRNSITLSQIIEKLADEYGDIFNPLYDIDPFGVAPAPDAAGGGMGGYGYGGGGWAGGEYGDDGDWYGYGDDWYGYGGDYESPYDQEWPEMLGEPPDIGD